MKQNKGYWWKILIVLTFITTLIIISLLVFEIKDVEIIKTRSIKATYIYTPLNRNKITILKSYCEGAYIEYPSLYSNEIWITNDVEGEDSYCHIIYKEKALRIKLK